jgi:hypothetical protein
LHRNCASCGPAGDAIIRFPFEHRLAL